MPDNVSTKSSEPSIHNSSLSRNLIDSSYSMEKSSHLFAQKMAVGYLEEDSNCWEFPKEKFGFFFKIIIINQKIINKLYI